MHMEVVLLSFFHECYKELLSPSGHVSKKGSQMAPDFISYEILL